MLKSLQIKGVKGLDTTVEFGPKTAIIGPNFSGKTGISDAIQMALIGYVPRLGKKNTATFQLASEPEMSVEATLTTGEIFRRSFTLKRGSVKLDEAEPFAWPAQLLDISLFLNASKKDKLAMVSASATASPEIAALVEEKTKLKGIDSLAKIEEELLARAETAKEIKAQLKTYEGTLSGTAAIDADQPVVRYDAEAHAAATVELEKIQHALVAAYEKSKAVMARNEAADAAADELESFAPGDIEELKAEIAMMTEAHGKQAAEVATIRGKLSSLEAALDLPLAVRESTARALKPLMTMDAAAMRLGRAEIATKLGDDYDDDAMVTLMETMNDQRAKATQSLTEAKAARLTKTAARVDLEKALQKLTEQVCCPMCFAGDDGWRDNATEYYTKRINNLQMEIDELNLECVDLTTLLEKITTNWNAVQAQRDLWKKSEALREGLAEFAKHEDAVAKIAAIELEKQGLQTELRKAIAAPYAEMIAAKHRQIDALMQTAKLRDAVNARPTDKEYNDAVNLVEGLKEQLVEQKQRLAQFEATKADSIREEERARTQQESRERLDVLKKTLDDNAEVLVGLNACIPLASESIWKAVNAAAAYFGDVLTECRLSVNDGEIGAWHGAAWVSFDALSGTEQLAAAAAIQAGLASTAPFRLLVLDELSRMTPETKGGFVAALNTMIAQGAVHQAIVIDHDKGFWNAVAGGWKIFDTSE